MQDFFNRKEEDGSVDNFFYDWHYYDGYNYEDIHQPPSGVISSFPNQPMKFQEINFFIFFCLSIFFFSFISSSVGRSKSKICEGLSE